MTSRPPALRVRAFAKINLMLKVIGTRADGYHELRTVFQSLALHDILTFTRVRGRFSLSCDDDACPRDASNVVWRAADQVWHAAGRAGAPHGWRIHIQKHIPVRAGLGGGSSDAAAALRACGELWRVNDEVLRVIAARLGADVPYFLEGGTALGLDRGDVLFPLFDAPAAWVVLGLPGFGVSTPDAFEWFDRTAQPAAANRGADNDLQAAVAARHPEIGTLVSGLASAGARQAAMTGSGSTVFGLFETRARAEAAAARLKRDRTHTLVTRTLSRAAYRRRSRPELPDTP